MLNLIFITFFLTIACTPSNGGKDSENQKWDSLPVNIYNFKKESRDIVKSVFELESTQNEKVGYVDGWVSLSDGGIAADHASLIYSVDISPKYYFNNQLQGLLVVGARGSLDFLLIDKADLQKNIWTPKAWEFLITPKAIQDTQSINQTYHEFKRTGLVNSNISKSNLSLSYSLYNHLKVNYKNLHIQFFDQIGIISVSAFSPKSEELRFTYIQANEMARFVSEQKSLIKGENPNFILELSTLSYRIPHSFSEIFWLDYSQKNFDLHNSRSVSRAANLEGWFFVTLPAFPPPFGNGPIMNTEKPRVTYQVIVKSDVNYNECKNMIEINGAKILEEYEAVQIMLVNFENEESFNKVSSLVCIDSIQNYQP